jgi:hypothetical protein
MSRPRSLATEQPAPTGRRYLVVARTEQSGPPSVPLRWGRCIGPSSSPVGTQHAVASPSAIAGPALLAMCGTDIRGWISFGHVPFGAGKTASCQRCAQLIAAYAGRLDARVSQPIDGHLLTARPAGLEPATNCLEGSRSIH